MLGPAVGHGRVFRPTLEEATRADLLLHTVDAALPDAASQVRTVREVLKEIDADSVPELPARTRLTSRRRSNCGTRNVPTRRHHGVRPGPAKESTT